MDMAHGETTGRVATGVGVAGLVALIAVAVARPSWRSRSRGVGTHVDERRAVLAAYLREHLTGSDAATKVVGRLRRSEEGTREGALFARLHDEFRGERDAVRALLNELGYSSVSVKRLAGQVGGVLFKEAAGGRRGDAALFRTLESLAIGVQGKRCLWRALHTLAHGNDALDPRTFLDFEAQAVEQWESIEHCRRALVPHTFSL